MFSHSLFALTLLSLGPSSSSNLSNGNESVLLRTSSAPRLNLNTSFSAKGSIEEAGGFSDTSTEPTEATAGGAASSTGTGESAGNSSTSADASSTDEESKKDSERYMIDTKSSPILGGWFSPEFAMGTLGYDTAAYEFGLTGGISLFGRLDIGLDLSYMSYLPGLGYSGWGSSDDLHILGVGGVLGVIIVNKKWFSFGIEAKLDYILMCQETSVSSELQLCTDYTTGFMADPRLTFVFRVTRDFRFRLFTGYWLGAVQSWSGPSGSELQGINAGLSIGLGKF